MDINERIRDKYNTNYEVNKYTAAKKLHDPEKVILEKYYLNIANKKVLDIGCGGGRTTEHLIKITSDYTGIDYSENMINSCKDQYENISFIHCDARDMSIFNDEQFDFILFSFNGISGLTHDARIKALKEIHRVLKTGGMFVFSSHNLNYKFIPYIPRIFRLNPVKLMENFKTKFINKLNYLKNKNKEIHTEEYSIIYTPGFNYALPLYHIRQNTQIKQLKDIGFSNFEIVSLSGEFIDINYPDKESVWLHYVCKK